MFQFNAIIVAGGLDNSQTQTNAKAAADSNIAWHTSFHDDIYKWFEVYYDLDSGAASVIVSTFAISLTVIVTWFNLH